MSSDALAGFPRSTCSTAPKTAARITSRLAPPSLLHVLFLLAVFFPYLQILPTGTDVQPTALFLAISILLFTRHSFTAPPQFWLLGCLLLIAVVVAFVGEVNFTAMRSVGNYASLFLISFASYASASRIRSSIPRLLAIANWIWFAVGLIQSVYFTEFLYFLLPDVRRTASRGIVALAPEPGYYATTCLFFLFVLFLYNREQSLQGLLCIVEITLLARSTIITVILLVIVVIYAMTHLTSRKAVAVLALLLAGWAIATQTDYFENTRIGDLTKLTLTSPSTLAKIDPSISDRIGQLIFSIKGAFDNYFLPNGFTAWGPYYHSEMLKAGGYLTMYYGDPYPKRIQSGVGGPLYELGIFGIIPLLVLAAGIKNHFRSFKTARAAVFGTAMGLSLLPGTPIATPILGLIIGQLYAFRRTGAGKEAA